MFWTMERIGIGELPPRLVRRDDDASGIEQGDVSGQCVQDGTLLRCFAPAQLFLGATQQDRPAFAVRHRIDRASQQFIQALVGRVKHLD